MGTISTSPRSTRKPGDRVAQLGCHALDLSIDSKGTRDPGRAVQLLAVTLMDMIHLTARMRGTVLLPLESEEARADERALLVMLVDQVNQVAEALK